MMDGSVTDILFLQDNGELLKYDFTQEDESKRRLTKKIFDIRPQDNWKMTTREVDFSTKSLICYEHTKAIMRIFDLY